jgi:hypothetical protein
VKRTEQHTTPDEAAELAATVHRVPLAEHELELVFVRIIVRARMAAVEDRGCIEVVRDKVGRLEQHVDFRG